MVCDLCQMDPAASACICRFPLPKLCIPCDTKHKNSSGSHFALPLAAIGTIGQGNWLQWHSYLVGVGVVLQNLMKSLEAFNTFQGQIEGIFASIHEELAILQNEYFAQLQEIRERTTAIVTAAIQEVCEHAIDSAFSSANPVVKAIFDSVGMGAIGEVHLFDIRVNEVSRDTLKAVVGLRIDPLVLGMPQFAGNWEGYPKEVYPIGEECPPVPQVAVLEFSQEESSSQLRALPSLIGYDDMEYSSSSKDLSMSAIRENCPPEETKISNIYGIACKQCSIKRDISAFRYYLFGTHTCLICDECYKRMPVSAIGDNCQLCTTFLYSISICDEITLAVSQKTTPAICCFTCQKKRSIDYYSVSQRLSHWWTCKVCDLCFEKVCGDSLPSLCLHCLSHYSYNDTAAIQLTFQPLEEFSMCVVCERVQAKEKFALVRKCKHKCQICEDCLLTGQKSSAWSANCPECKADFTPEVRKSVIQAETTTKLKAEMMATSQCLKCMAKKPQFDMRKCAKLHHECAICDQCLGKNGVAARCILCLTFYNEHDRRFLEKVLTDNKTVPKPSTAATCPCGNQIRLREPHCSQKCRCFQCLFRNLLLRGSSECPSCNQRIAGLSSSLLPRGVECSGCLRKLTTTVSLQICGVCPNNCVLCFLCVQVDQSNRALCRNCLVPIDNVNADEVSARQQSFSLGCYCAGQGGDDERLPCTHQVHSRCLPTLDSCRICAYQLRDKPRYKTLRNYLPAFS